MNAEILNLHSASCPRPSGRQVLCEILYHRTTYHSQILCTISSHWMALMVLLLKILFQAHNIAIGQVPKDVTKVDSISFSSHSYM